jgi:hypothetical protein
VRAAALTASLLVLAALPASCTRSGGGSSLAAETPSANPVPPAPDGTAEPAPPRTGTPAEAGTGGPTTDAATAPGVATMEQLLALVEALAQPTFGVTEAQALLGPISSPQPVRVEGFEDFVLQPAAGLERAVLETHRGELIGIQLDFGPEGLPVRTNELQDLWGAWRDGPAPLDSMLPATLVFDRRGTAYQLLLMLQPAEPPAEGTASLRDAVLRRTPIEEFVPERWSSADDLVALFRLVFRAGPLEPVVLYGNCGVFAGRDGDEIRLSAAESRNVAEGRVVAERGPDGFDEVRAVRLWFVEPIAVDPARLAEQSGARLEEGAEGPLLVFDRGRATLRLNGSRALTELSCLRTLEAAP